MSAANKLVPVVDGTAGTPIELQDARISVNGTPSNHDILMYNSTTQKFENTSFPTIPTVPTNVSSFTNDAGYITVSGVPTEILMCTFNGDTNVMSHTATQIRNAVSNKKVVLCQTGNMIYHCTVCGYTYLMFVNIDAGISNGTTLTGEKINYLFYYDNDGQWVRSSFVLQEQITNVSSLTNDAGYITASNIPQEVIWCSFTESDSTNHVGTMSMTISEMQTAVNAGKIICLKRGNFIYHLTSDSLIDAMFVAACGPVSYRIQYFSSDQLWHYFPSRTQNVQSDWNQTDNTADDYIKNKPQNLVTDANYVHTDNNYTTADQTKLSGIESGAEANVQSDWTEDDSTEDSYILHKPVEGNDIEMTDLLPYGFTALDYVSNASNTYIDTGIAPDIDDFEMELVVRPSTGSWYIWQSRPSGGGATTGISGANSGSTITFNFCGTTLTSSITRSTSSTYTIKAKAKNGVMSLYVKKHSDGTEDLKTGTYIYSRQTLPFYLFGNQNGNRVNANNRIYRARMWKGGKLVLDYIPAKTIDTNTILLYEAVCNGKTEPTAGTLSAGNAITMPVTIGLKSSICNNTIHAPIEVGSGGTVTETINAAEGNGINTYIVKNGSGNPNTELTLNYIRPEWSCGMRDCIVFDNTDASGNLYVSIEPRVKGYNSTVVYGASAISVKNGDCAIADIIVSLVGSQAYAVVNVNGIASRKSITF